MESKKGNSMDKITKAYLDRASEIIGERTKSEILHDDSVVEVSKLQLLSHRAIFHF